MVEDRIGYRYAKSIFDLAKEKGLLDDVRADMELVHETSVQSRDFRNVLNSPIIPSEKKRKILAELFSKRYQTDFSRLLTDILVRKGRERYLDDVAKAFLQLYDIEKHIQRGVLTTAAPLSNAQIARIKEQIEERTDDQFEFEVVVDPEILGGFVLKLGNQLFDGSVTGQLRRIKQEIVTDDHERKI